MSILRTMVAATTALLVLASGTAFGAAPSNTMHVRGTVRSLSQNNLTVETGAGTVTVQLVQPLKVVDIVPASRSLITSGRFVGVTSVATANGSQKAVEVHVFPDSMRGSGEGSRPWDYPGARLQGSRMTNGTVAPAAVKSRMTNGTIARKAGGSAIVVTYKSTQGAGAQTIMIPPGIPIVKFEPGAPSDLEAGAHVFIIAERNPDGTLTAMRVVVGKGGARPPM